MQNASGALTIFDPVTAQWFADSIGTPTLVQEQGWPAIAAGGHVLVSAPTGTGKTLCSFLVFIDRLKAQARRGELKEELQLLYISPLKALGNDIRENLRRPLDGIDSPEITVAIRTGDTTQAERRRMLKHPPHILITTPESLYLLLTSHSGRELLKPVQAVILDELHAILGTKRGAHLMFSLARLDRLCGRSLQRIGLSATIEPLSLAGDYLACPNPVTIIAPPMHKDVDIAVNAPLEDMRTLPEGSIWPEIARQVYEQSLSARTVIAFVEGRTQAEKLAFHVNALGGEGFARTHHGCVSKEQRLEAEMQLRSGELRLLCATSSMELGIDVGEVDLVLQLGFPRTISSTMQRLGRAGHNPGRTSVMHMFPRMMGETITCGLTARVALDGGIEHANPPRKCLDVLAQQLVSMAAVETYTVDEALALTHNAYNFRDVTREELTNVLSMMAGDYEHEMDHPARPRLLYDRIHGTVEGDQYSRLLALSAGGTIPDRGYFTVRLSDGTRLGELDEEFVFEARIGDRFLLGAFAWRIEEIRQDSVVVSPTTSEGAQSPFWKGETAGRTVQTGYAFGRLLRGLTEAHAAGRLPQALDHLRLDDWAIRNTMYLLNRQFDATGCLPDDRTILIEHFQDSAGEHQMMVHSIFGGRVNAALAVLVQDTVRRVTGLDVATFDDDDGFLIFPYGTSRQMPEGLLQRVDPRQARRLLEALLPSTPLFNMAFRYNAGRALLMGVRKGRRQPLWIQRLRGAQVLDGAVTNPNHPLIQETRRECLEDYWDLPALEKILTDIQSGAIAVREVRLNAPSPMALPLRRAAEATLMYEYSPTPQGVHRAVAGALAAENEAMMPPAPEQLERVAERRRQPQDENQLHALLMAEGDLIAGEVDVPVQWLEALAYGERALYIEPGLWVCAEQREQYRAALEENDADTQQRVLRRLLRYRGPQNAQSVSSRYFWPEAHAQQLLDALAESNTIVRDGDVYYHADLYSRAQRETVAMRRRQVATLPPERYAALVSQRTRTNASAAEQLDAAMEMLVNQPFPPAYWESILLPARCGGYKPAMLDELLSQGSYFWQFIPGEKPLLSFHRACDIDWEHDALATEADLSADDRRIADALARRGASFAQNLGGVLEGRSPLEALMRLAEGGFVHADSFAPVRQWLDGDKPKSKSARVRVGGRVKATLSGRWELTRPLVMLPMADMVERALERAGILCRETAQSLPWGDALEVLRVWEYTGRVRRGYFIQGLSGAQFIGEAAYQQTILQLENPRDDILWLNAADPAQPWGKAIAHLPEQSFTNVPGTAVALRAGLPVALLERQGHTLRVFEPQWLAEAMGAFARDYRQGRIFAGLTRIVLKQYPDTAKEALEAAGFARQMLDYEIWQKKI